LRVDLRWCLGDGRDDPQLILDTGGRPERGRSRSPGIPARRNRARHRRTVSTQIRRSRAIFALGSRRQAASTILARSTRCCGALAAATIRSSRFRRRFPSMMTSWLLARATVTSEPT
jgi:hypothetical protein